MPTKVSEMNCRFCGTVENLVCTAEPSTPPAIEIVAVEKHAGADQPENPVVKRRDRQPVEPRAGVDCVSHVEVPPPGNECVAGLRRLAAMLVKTAGESYRRSGSGEDVAAVC